MRIAQVVTYISKDGAFGGPVAVAVAQARELAAQGHEVELIATWDGEAELQIPGVDVHLFRVQRQKRLQTIVSPALMRYVRRNRNRWDAIHLHFGRDLVSLGAWIASRGAAGRVVLQPHGMLPPSTRPSARVIDALVVRRALRGADAVLALTEHESSALASVASAPLRPIAIRNGVAVPAEVDLAREDAAEVLFLARLHPRKNVMVFAGAARRLRDEGTGLRFRVVGPDEGDLPLLQRYIDDHDLGDVLTYGGVVGPGGSSAELSRAAALVLPSVGEVFPMTVLESLAQGTPVVLSEDCALSAPLGEADAARITVPEEEPVAAAIASVVLDEPTRVALAGRGHRFAQQQYGMGAIAAQLGAIYSAPPRPGPAAAVSGAGTEIR